MQQPASHQDSRVFLEPPPSLWRLVEDQVPPSERAEMKRILGEAAIDLSLDLHAEVSVLQELCRDAQIQASGFCPVLPDPPVMKAMVTQEIRMLLLSVRMRARHQGLDEVQALSKYSPRVVTFVMGSGSMCSDQRRPPSGGSGGNEHPDSARSTRQDDLEDLKDKLQMSDIDEVILHLRSLLEEECNNLEKDVTILQQRLEDEQLHMEESRAPLAEPSLTELRKERRTLERDLQVETLQAPIAPTFRKAESQRLLDFRRGGIADYRAPSCAAASAEKEERGRSPPRSAPQRLERALSPPRSAPQRLERASMVNPPLCDWGADPVQAPCISLHRIVPPRALVTPVNTRLAPSPPKVQRPPGSSGSVPAFRRVKTRVTNLPV